MAVASLRFDEGFGVVHEERVHVLFKGYLPVFEYVYVTFEDLDYGSNENLRRYITKQRLSFGRRKGLCYGRPRP